MVQLRKICEHQLRRRLAAYENHSLNLKECLEDLNDNPKIQLSCVEEVQNVDTKIKVIKQMLEI